MINENSAGRVTTPTGATNIQASKPETKRTAATNVPVVFVFGTKMLAAGGASYHERDVLPDLAGGVA